MNVQNAADTTRDVAAQALEVAKTVQALRREDAKTQAAAPADASADEKDKAKDGTGDSLAQKDPQKILEQAKQYFSRKGVSLDFKRIGETGDVQVEMVDDTSHKVIRKIPEDEVVKLSENIKKMAKGVMDKAV